MKKTIAECDNPKCDRVEQIFQPSINEVPAAWIAIKVIVPNRSWPFGVQNRTFCSWKCVGWWGLMMDDTNGEGPKKEVAGQTGEDPVSGWKHD